MPARPMTALLPTTEETARYVVAEAVWAPSVHNTPAELPRLRESIRTHLGDGAYPHLVLRIGLVTQGAASVRRDPDDGLLSPQ